MATGTPAWRGPRVSSWRALGLLASSGASLATTQFLVLRELGSALYGEEVVLLLVSLCTFAAMSLGYAASNWLSVAWQRGLLALTVVLHLTLPMAPRVLFAGLAAADWRGAWPLLAAMLLSVLLLSPICTVLPRTLTEPSDRVRALREGYSAELLGFVVGLGCVQAAQGFELSVLLGMHWAWLALLLAFGLPQRWPAPVFACCAALLWPGQDARARGAGERLYRHAHGMSQAQLRFSRDSAYQRVEVVDNGVGRRSLYLDGLENLNATDLALLNEYLGLLPARVMRPARTLLIGNGTLSMVPQLARLSGELHSVELDPVVVQAGLEWFTPPQGLASLHNWRSFEGDGKDFLARSDERYDLVIVDVPSPLTFQEAFLHTREFYRLVRSRLREGGLIAVQLSGDALGGRPSRTPMRVAASLCAEFEEVMVLQSRSAQRAFAYAGAKVELDPEALRSHAPPAERGLEIVTPEAVRRHTEGVRPLDLDSLDLVLRRGAQRLWQRSVP